MNKQHGNEMNMNMRYGGMQSHPHQLHQQQQTPQQQQQQQALGQQNPQLLQQPLSHR